MFKQLTASILSLLFAAPVHAANGNILLAFDSNAGSYCTNVPPGDCARMWVFGLLQGASAGGITGAEYRIEMTGSANPGYLFQETFAPGAIVLGSGALTPGRGVDVAWPACMQGDGIKVLIESVEILNLGNFPTENRLQVVKHDVPANAFFQCPLFVLCDAPVYTKVCLGYNLTPCRNPEPPFANDATCSTSSEAWLNPGPSIGCGIAVSPCTIAVEPQSWSRVKSLYKD